MEGQTRTTGGEQHGLARRLAKRNESAWREFYDRYAGRMYTYAYYRLNGNNDDAETVVAETFIAAARTARNLGSDRPLEGWIYTIARSKVMDILRRRRKQQLLIERIKRIGKFADTIEHADTRLIPPEILQDREFSQIVGKVMTSLPLKYQIALTGRYLDEADVGEIARRIGCHRSTVDGIVFRARKAFAHKFKESGEALRWPKLAQSA